MQQGRRAHDWEQTAQQMALLANVNRDTKRKRTPYDPRIFLPPDLRSRMRSLEGIKMNRESLHALKPIFDGANHGDSNT